MQTNSQNATAASNPVYGHRPGSHVANTTPSQASALNANSMLGLAAASKFARKAGAKAGTFGDYFLELDKPASAGIPVREMMTQIFLYERARSVKEFFIYFIYVAIFVSVVAQINDSNVSQQETHAIIRCFTCRATCPPSRGLTNRRFFYTKHSLPVLHPQHH